MVHKICQNDDQIVHPLSLHPRLPKNFIKRVQRDKLVFLSGEQPKRILNIDQTMRRISNFEQFHELLEADGVLELKGPRADIVEVLLWDEVADAVEQGF